MSDQSKKATANHSDSVRKPPVSRRDILGDPIPRDKILSQIGSSPDAAKLFDDLPAEAQEKVLCYLEGSKSLQIRFFFCI